MPAPLLEEFKRFAKRTETSHANLLMDAIAAHHDDLTDLVVQARPAPTSDGLFVRDTPRKAEPLSTLSIRIRAANVEAIDRLVDTSGAASRSHLCTAAMTAYLGHAARGSEA
ncbi:hypothetical protein PZ938_00135 [Luteipulveratus sp. YIM 133132]|uniref:hypothetical protein n=1 Tax=Luteipulveratus flavus TaxID=3031728 RepID=UPI0023AFC5F2|nr:hypothetical protein [Luteipulveratus sp. YIM 133132]MDE9364002.1 hypothetical protein [Luteipulveratus sp. YIM 133132]